VDSEARSGLDLLLLWLLDADAGEEERLMLGVRCHGEALSDARPSGGVEVEGVCGAALADSGATSGSLPLPSAAALSEELDQSRSMPAR
jgi:hypothetical protein